MWNEKLALGCWCWEHDSGKRLFIVHRNRWDVDLNFTTKTSRSTFEEVKVLVDKYMEKFP